jgi:FkbM family methyltransferase
MNALNELLTHNFDATSRFVQEFESSSPNLRYLLGTNRYAEALTDIYKFAGVIDESTTQSHWRGLPIIPLGQLPKGAMVICTATGRPHQAMRKLTAHPVWAIDFFSFRKLRPQGLPEIRFNEEFICEFSRNYENFEKTYNQLADFESKKIFSKLIDFRLNQNLFTIADFKEKQDEQYFDDCVQLQADNETFFDIGGFEGETTLAFFDRAGLGSKALVFEPQLENYQRCHNNLAHLPNVSIHSVALSDGRLQGCMVGEGSNAHIEFSTKHELAFSKVDDFAQENPTFIKVDVEGHEMNVLAGAKQVLTHLSPKLAIATYHQPDHFWRIPELVLGIQPKYTLLLRHYTESIYESVYYFIPSTRSHSRGTLI